MLGRIDRETSGCEFRDSSRRRTDRVSREPQVASGREWLDAKPRPPNYFLAGPVKVAMVDSAQGHSELITDLLRETVRLRKA